MFEERVAWLRKYLTGLQAEAQAVEERLAELIAERQADGTTASGRRILRCAARTPSQQITRLDRCA